MYFPNNPKVVEGDDILEIVKMEFQGAGCLSGGGENPCPLLTVTFTLDPKKAYTPELFHVTNGTEHRLLAPKQVESEPIATSEEEQEEIPVPPLKLVFQPQGEAVSEDDWPTVVKIVSEGQEVQGEDEEGSEDSAE